MKRQDYLTWNEYFMFSACLAAERSKDPVTQVGAVIVNENNRIIGSGYNGFCNGISDDSLSWGKGSSDPLNNKYMYVCHGELNAIMNCIQFSKGCTMYVTLFPCAECAKAIIQSGIKKIVYAHTPDKEKPTYKASTVLLSLAGIETVLYEGKRSFSLMLD